MKKLGKKLLIFIGTLILVIVTIGIINFYPIITMKPAETGEIADTGIVAVKNRVNSLYFIKSSEGYILVDAGSDVNTIEKALTEVNIKPSDVKYILLTHSDSDHVASLNLFTNAKIFMSEDELQMINGTTKRDGNKYNSLPNNIEQDSLILLKEKEELIIGEHKIECIKAPGHTPGSMVFLFDRNYLFLGDVIKVSKNTVGIHPFTMDSETSKKTVQKLNEIIKGSKLILTAHYGYYKPESLTLSNS